jgi:hypothetical protein
MAGSCENSNDPSGSIRWGISGAAERLSASKVELCSIVFPEGH